MARAARKSTPTRPRKSTPANRGHGKKGVKKYDPSLHPRGPDGKFLSKGGATSKATKTPRTPKASKPPKPPVKPRKVGTAKQRKGLADQIRKARAGAKTPEARTALAVQVRALRQKRSEWKRGQGKGPQVEKLPRQPKPPKEPKPKKEKAAKVAKPPKEKSPKSAKGPKAPEAAPPPNPMTPVEAAVAYAQLRGVKVETRGSAVIRGDHGEDARRIPAVYNSQTKTVYLNEHHEYWANPAATMESWGGAKWMSSKQPDHIIVHEVGHALHNQAIGDTNYQRARTLKLKDEQAALIHKEVSHYAATKPVEFVAEAYAGIKAGKTYSAGVMDLYRKLGGPT